MKPTYILGISAFYHDAAAALLKDSGIIAAAHGIHMIYRYNMHELYTIS